MVLLQTTGSVTDYRLYYRLQVLLQIMLQIVDVITDWELLHWMAAVTDYKFCYRLLMLQTVTTFTLCDCCYRPLLQTIVAHIVYSCYYSLLQIVAAVPCVTLATRLQFTGVATTSGSTQQQVHAPLIKHALWWSGWGSYKLELLLQAECSHT